MNVRRADWGLRWLALFLGAALALTGCGGGGGGGGSSDGGPDSPPAAKTVSGVVADGYLVGATVFSDRNGNKKWDEGEPKAVTGPGGAYLLEGADVDRYPVAVLVDVGVRDEDTDAAVTKGYLLTAPAGRPAFISPLTTLVQGQIEANPALAPDDAEAVVRQRIGAPGEVSLFDDYVSGAAASDAYAGLHRVARVVAATFGEMQEQVETVAAAAGYEPEEILDALVDIVGRRVMEELPAIAVAVDQAGEAADPVSVAETVVADINRDAPLSSDSIGHEIDQARTPVVASSFRALLRERGSHWLLANDDAYSGYELQYGVVTLNGDGETLNEEMFEYDFSASSWRPTSEESDYYLVGGVWTPASDSADGLTVSFHEDGTMTAGHPELGQHTLVSASAYDLTGQPMGSFLSPVLADLLADPSETFPSGAKAYQISFKELSDRYELWGDEETPFASMVSDYAKGSGHYLHWSGLYLQFGADGTADVFLDRSGTRVQEWTGTWEDEVVQGQSVRVLHLPPTAILASGDEGAPIFVEWTDGSAWKGQYLAAGEIYAETQAFDFNKAAFDAILENLDLTAPGGDPGEGGAFDNASLGGVWILSDSAGSEDVYAEFDGAGAITEVGGFNVPSPAGSYDVQENGDFVLTFSGFGDVTGSLASDTRGVWEVYGSDPIYKVTDPSLCQGTWFGSLSDTATTEVIPVTIVVDASGTVTIFDGLAGPTSGRMFCAGGAMVAKLNTGESGEYNQVALVGDLSGSGIAGVYQIDNGNQNGSDGVFSITRQ